MNTPPTDIRHPMASSCEQFLRMSGMGVLVGDFYLDLGVSKRPCALPDGVQAGRMRECYRNAALLAMDHDGMTYCEGYAMRPGMFPMHHAWCLDAQGQVIDPTWPFDPDNQYLGVVFKQEFLLESCQRTGVWGILGEFLPPEVTELHPKAFLDETWMPESDRIDSWMQKVATTAPTKRATLRQP